MLTCRLPNQVLAPGPTVLNHSWNRNPHPRRLVIRERCIASMFLKRRRSMVFLRGIFAGHPHRIGYLTALDHHGLLIRPVKAIQVASAYRPRSKALAGRPLRVIRENPLTILAGTEPLGPSRVATMERALLDAASWPKLVGGASRIAESLAAVMAIKGLAELAHAVSAEAGYRRIGSISTALSLAVGHGLEPEPWRTLVDLDTTAQHEHGWVDRTWGVAWPYPVSQLEAAVAS